MATALSLAKVAGSTAVIYLFLIVILRLFGRRQLGQLSVIDLIVVLILGSAVETAMIHGNLTLPAAFTSAATLLAVNKLLTLLFLRSERLRHRITVRYRRGEWNMQRVRKASVAVNPGQPERRRA
jgi:uncharacterized membrane protein YcaP (DUF421 family)